jgi:hypothetical protein
MQAEASLVNERTLVQARVKLADVMQAMKVQKLSEMHTEQWGTPADWYQTQEPQKPQQQKKMPKSKQKAQDFFLKCKKWKQEKQNEARDQALKWAWSAN